MTTLYCGGDNPPAGDFAGDRTPTSRIVHAFERIVDASQLARVAMAPVIPDTATADFLPDVG